MGEVDFDIEQQARVGGGLGPRRARMPSTE